MSVKMRIEVEKKIIGQFVKDALTAGHKLSVSLERGYDLDEMLIASTDHDKIMEEAFAGDECHIFVHNNEDPTVEDGRLIADGWVYCVYGNDGWDVISDYTTNLEHLLQEAHKISDHYSDY
jgi:hypothetical protein